MGQVQTFLVSRKDYYKNGRSRIRLPVNSWVVALVDIKVESQIERGDYLWGYCWGCQTVGDYGSLENANFRQYHMLLAMF